LHEFLSQHIRGCASLCYFNYRQSGERIGRALIGLDFASSEARAQLLAALPSRGDGYRLCEKMDAAAQRRLVGY